MSVTSRRWRLRRSARSKALFGLGLILILTIGRPAFSSALTFNVTRTDDPSPGHCLVGDCSLREAVIDGNNNPGSIINLPSGSYYLTRSGLDESSYYGDLDITGSVTIIGIYATINAGSLSPRERAFHVLGGATLSMSGVTVTGGSEGLDYGGGIFIQNGGADLYNCTLAGNSAMYGGGIYNQGRLVINNCTLYGNTATTSGGGFYNSGVANLTNSTISGNGAVSGNGGGLLNYTGVIGLSFVTVAQNSVNITNGGGGGIYNAGGTVYLDDTLIVGNTGREPDVSGAMASSGYNLVYNSYGGWGFTPLDRLNPASSVAGIIAPLAGNGGPTLTHALVYTSPAIDAGSPNFTPPSNYDQRGYGYPRVRNNRVDIGAYEYQSDDGGESTGAKIQISVNSEGGCGVSASKK
ncbi:MAG: hypothetical protein HQK55_10460 [Deltaproteobacteria bacterium]|nr:hypothetical protein [Deltaproteobacteria bacterium]